MSQAAARYRIKDECAAVDVVHSDVVKSAACEPLSVGRERHGTHSVADLDGIVDPSPFHVVNNHSQITDRNEPIIRRDGNLGGVPWVSPFLDKLVRFDVPNFDAPFQVTADDLRPIPGRSKTGYSLLMLHRCPFLLPIVHIPYLYIPVSRTGDDASSVGEIHEPLDDAIVRRNC